MRVGRIVAVHSDCLVCTLKIPDTHIPSQALKSDNFWLLLTSGGIHCVTVLVPLSPGVVRYEAQGCKLLLINDHQDRTHATALSSQRRPNMSIYPTSLPSLPSLATSSDAAPSGPLASALATLFEASPVLYSDLVPALLHSSTDIYTSYGTLVDAAVASIKQWPREKQAVFVGGHPRIGEVNALSALSAAEQASKQTPHDVLERLAKLNELYEAKYEGLRYITFVDGRSRKEIMEEMQEKLDVESGQNVDVDVQSTERVVMESDEWEKEVKRAVEAVGNIAKARLRTMGFEADASS